MSIDLGKVITAMITPFNEKLEVDYVQAVKLAERLASEGTDTVLLAGTTGESPTLTTEEKLQLFEKVTTALKGKIPIMAGTGGNNTKASIELSKEAEKLGVDCILLVVPYYNKPPQDALYAHYKAIANAVSLPIILYNVPSRTVTNLEPSTVSKLSQIDNIIGIKEACGNMDQISSLKMLVPEDFKIYSGDDSLTLPMLSLGCHGVVSVASNVIGREIQEMVTLFMEGRFQEARELHYKLMPVFKAMFITTNPAPVKAAVNMTGLNAGSLRLPLLEVDPKQKQLIYDELKAFRKVNI
ncbi:4-hydroxy-tetrahydrodipicolinate synthase [Desulfitibacter alkalitolerans]|uniref:4-hydroxy-tetrahydrodipicolinate synthase n=1 Tax=Desulfitibacter alkalitolerans TaxID=264641 RepID=UPI0004803067|nr:4-hydroxy-tetrahydrodipicolinate synthase [Desulfitibacter alkalitolerans]